jgi:hypothetical protein
MADNLKEADKSQDLTLKIAMHLQAKEEMIKSSASVIEDNS